MTQKTMYKLSILKWEHIVNNFDEYLEHSTYTDYWIKQQLPKLKNLDAACAFCEVFRTNKRNGCQACPLYQADQHCLKRASFWDIAIETDVTTQLRLTAAIDLLSTIITLAELEGFNL